MILETIRVEFYVQNALQVRLLMNDVQILWKHSSVVWKRKASVTTDSNEDAKEFTNDTLIKQVNDEDSISISVINSRERQIKFPFFHL